MVYDLSLQTADAVGAQTDGHTEASRPPMDLFKAIFAASESSSEEEEDVIETKTAAPDIVKQNPLLATQSEVERDVSLPGETNVGKMLHIPKSPSIPPGNGST